MARIEIAPRPPVSSFDTERPGTSRDDSTRAEFWAEAFVAAMSTTITATDLMTRIRFVSADSGASHRSGLCSAGRSSTRYHYAAAQVDFWE